MPIPQEVDDLEREITRLKQVIGKGNAKITTLQSKVDSALRNIDYCENLRRLCITNAVKMVKEPLVVLQEYREIIALHRSNADLVQRHRNEAAVRRTELEQVRKEVPMAELELAVAQKQLAQWGVVLRFER
jgi:hypothetical protein